MSVDPSLLRRLTSRLAATGDPVTTCCPFDGQPIGSIPQSTPADVEGAFSRARTAQARWARTPLSQRQAMLLRLHDLVLDRLPEINDLVCLESGKARKDAYDEVLHVALTARYYGRIGHAHLGPHRRAGVVPGLTRVDVNRVPKGVVGVIAPWNYPFTLALSDGVPALLAGNAVVTKPDGQTVLSGLLGAELLEEAGCPADLWQVVAGAGADIGPEVVDRADHVCFTGSTATGREVARRCADRLVGCSLELGGKNPMLVLRDADLDRAAEGAVRASYSSAGQLCVSTERLFVADQVYDRFLRRFVARVQAMRLRSGAAWGSDMGTLVSQRQLDRTVAHIQDARAKGARVLAGGRARPDLGPFFHEPTVLEGVWRYTDLQSVATQRLLGFGPVLGLRDEVHSRVMTAQLRLFRRLGRR